MTNDPSIEAMLKRADRELQADQSSQKVYSGRFLLRYEDAVAPDLARQMVAILEAEYARVSAELGCHIDERLVTIVQTPATYRRTTQAQEWSGGQYSGRIHIALLEGNRIGQQTREVFAHELVHACLANLGRWPIWLNEGLAQRLSGARLDPRLRPFFKRLPKLSEMGETWAGLSSEQAGLAYGMALAAVELFYQHHAALGIRNLLRNPAELPRITEDLDRRLRE